MKVKELMVRDVRTCFAEDDLNRAAQIMWESDCGTVPVVDAAGIVKGMITDRDVCMAAYTKGRTLGGIHVRSAMARDVVACSPEDTLESALSVMKKARVRRLPVTERNGKLVGIVSISDLVRETWRQIESEDRHAITVDLASTLSAICDRSPTANPAKRDAKPPAGLVRAGA